MLADGIRPGPVAAADRHFRPLTGPAARPSPPTPDGAGLAVCPAALNEWRCETGSVTTVRDGLLERNRVRRRVMKALADPEVLALMRRDPDFAGLFNQAGELDAVELPPEWRQRLGLY